LFIRSHLSHLIWNVMWKATHRPSLIRMRREFNIEPGIRFKIIVHIITRFLHFILKRPLLYCCIFLEEFLFFCILANMTNPVQITGRYQSAFIIIFLVIFGLRWQNQEGWSCVKSLRTTNLFKPVLSYPFHYEE
jgi:hypothetical protein